MARRPPPAPILETTPMKFPRTNLTRTLAAAILATAALSVAGAASADTRWEKDHPRQDQVLDRVNHQEARIRHERREGEISKAQAHRMMRADRRIAREDHVVARANGGFITKREQRHMDRQENQLGRHIPG
jgi:hypothetical protein